MTAGDLRATLRTFGFKQWGDDAEIWRNPVTCQGLLMPELALPDGAEIDTETATYALGKLGIHAEADEEPQP